MPRAKTTARRLMTTPRQRLRWLVDFVARDVTTLREGDLVHVREELRDFLLPLHSSIAPGDCTWSPMTSILPRQSNTVAPCSRPCKASSTRGSPS